MSSGQVAALNMQGSICAADPKATGSGTWPCLALGKLPEADYALALEFEADRARLRQSGFTECQAAGWNECSDRPYEQRSLPERCPPSVTRGSVASATADVGMAERIHPQTAYQGW